MDASTGAGGPGGAGVGGVGGASGGAGGVGGSGSGGGDISAIARLLAEIAKNANVDTKAAKQQWAGTFSPGKPKLRNYFDLLLERHPELCVTDGREALWQLGEKLFTNLGTAEFDTGNFSLVFELPLEGNGAVVDAAVALDEQEMLAHMEKLKFEQKKPPQQCVDFHVPAAYLQMFGDGEFQTVLEKDEQKGVLRIITVRAFVAGNVAPIRTARVGPWSAAPVAHHVRRGRVTEGGAHGQGRRVVSFRRQPRQRRPCRDP